MLPESGPLLQIRRHASKRTTPLALVSCSAEPLRRTSTFRMAGGWEHEPGNDPQQSADCEIGNGDGWMPIGERHCERIQGKAQKSFAPFRLLDGKFDWIRGAGAMEMSSDGRGENDERQTAEEEFARINGNGKGVELFTQHVAGGEWDERQ